MQKDVTQGKSYCLTVYSVPCKVTAIGKNNIEYTLLNVSETGQYLFIAPTWKVNISQDDASIVETFNLAGTGKVGGSGSGSDPTYGLLKIIFVDALPPISEAKENTLYFVPKNGSAPDNYNEYIFDPVNQQFELVGQSAIDTSDFAKLSSTNIFLAPNTFDEIITFKKGLKVSESGPVITSNDTTLNLPNTSTPLLKAQSLILNGVSTFNNEIRVPTIAGLTSTPIKVTSAVNFTSNSDTNFSGNINTPNINVTDLITIPSGKIQTNDLGKFIIGQNIETPTIANNGAFQFEGRPLLDKGGFALVVRKVKNGVWTKTPIIPANLWDFSYSTDAELQVRIPTKDLQAANKLYVDTSISTISQFDSSSDQIISGTWEFSKPLKIAEAQLANEAVSKGYVDTNLSSKVNLTDVYTKTEINDNYATKTEVADIKVTANAAAERAESAAQEASNARNDAQNAKKEAEKSAESAATSATSAANSATAAANALAAIPQVDASGNMTLAGGLTAAGAVNANGGINIPLAVGAATDTSAVNRLYAAGLAAVTDAFSVRCYPLLADCSSSNGTVFKTDREPNSLYFNVPPNSSFTVKCGLATNARPMHNYSSIRGWVAPLRLPSVSTKFTARFGQMTTVARMGRDRDAFTLVPDQAAGGYRIGEIIDITFDPIRDADAGGYHIRVREIYYSNAEQKWKMKTTQAFAQETSSNNGYPVCVYAVVYEQYQDGGYDTEDRGALWLLHGGNSSRGCVKIATVKGVHCFENIYPFSGYYLDMENTNSWALAGAFLPATMHLHCNNVNPAYYGFSSMESNIIVSEAVEDFVDPEAETITED